MWLWSLMVFSADLSQLPLQNKTGDFIYWVYFVWLPRDFYLQGPELDSLTPQMYSPHQSVGWASSPKRTPQSTSSKVFLGTRQSQWCLYTVLIIWILTQLFILINVFLFWVWRICYWFLSWLFYLSLQCQSTSTIYI
jgi:hypothetical protein